MERYLSVLDKKESRGNTVYYAMKSISLDNRDKGDNRDKDRRLLFPDSNYTFKEDTLYRIDVEEDVYHKSEEINSWQDMNNEVCQSITTEKTASLIIELLNCEHPENNTIVADILNNYPDEAEKFKYELLSAIIKNHHSCIVWAIEKAGKLFPIDPNNDSYFIDIEQDVIDTFLKSLEEKDFELWKTVITHDPSILQSADGDEKKCKFVKFTIDTLENLIKKEALIFDIEGNKDIGIGWEFYYNQNENFQYVKPLEGLRLLKPDQWKELEDAITNSKIIVGHNIRKWDYKLLEQRNKDFGKDSKYLNNTWDTIEIELLLNPSRPSFALNAENGHKAEKDVRATKCLFLQQLYLILSSKESYNKVKEYLPSIVVSQIDLFADIIYSRSDFSKHSNEKHNELFYKPVCQEIPELNEYTSGSFLIIAEEDSWQTIFHKFNARFYSDSALDEYNSLDLHKIINDYSNTQNIYERSLYTIANDCVPNGKRLNIKAIPKIIRCAITDKALREYVLPEAEPNVICIKPEIVDDFNCDVAFDNVLILCDSLIPRNLLIKNCNEQIIEIIEEQCEYSIYTQAFPVNVESLAKLGIKANPCKEYWIAQPVPKEFAVLSRMSEQLIFDTLKKNYPNAKFLGKDNSSIVEDFINASPSFEENDNNCIFDPGKYWASRLEAFNKYKTQKPKILIVDTYEQAKSASKYLGIKYANKGNIRKAFDKAVEQAGYNVITVLQDLLDCDVYDLGASFCFILNDTAILSKQGKGEHFDKAKVQLKNRLSLFGYGSQIQFLGDLLHPDAISEEQIIKAEECFDEKDNIILTNDDLNPLLDWIKNKYNIIAFRGLQEPAIKKVVEYKGSKRNFLTILPTGGGKSLIFQGPILYKAIVKGSKKLSIVITPLQALMEDQVKDLISKVFNSSLIAYINANTPSEKKEEIISSIRKHEVRLLYIAPERLMDRYFFQKIIRTAAEDQGIDSIIFDEAHCITAWGMDFRSDYILALRKCLKLQKAHKGITIQMFTATLPWQSKEDLKAEIQFGEEDCNILPSSDSEEYKKSLCPIRDHIELQIVKTESDKREEANGKKLESILNNLDDRAIGNLTSDRSRMILFTYSRSDAEESAEWLKEQIQDEVLKERISFFHARIERHEKERIIRQFKEGEILILCATKAFGLGMNIPNVHYLFHLTPPTFIEDYLQEVGRAARKTEEDNYIPYMEAFPIENGKREPVKAICYYTKYDIENRLDRIQRILWGDVRDSFEDIKKYVSNFRNPNGRYIIPVDLLASKERTDSESKNKSKDDDLIEKFEQCLGWLSKPNGLNRIQLGFRCPDSYDLGYDSNTSGLSESSQLYALIKYLRETHVIQKNNSRIIIQANSIIGNSPLGIDSVEELESIIDEGVKLGVFNRNFMYISVSLKNKKYLMDFIENRTEELDVLSVLCESLKERHIDGFNLEHNLDGKINNIKKEKKILDKEQAYFRSLITKSWDFFVDLNKIYTVDEIKENCKKLILAIGQSKAVSVSWSILENSIDAAGDAEKLKLFLYATSKLSYTTKGSANTDFIEISILNEAELNENTDSEAKKEINNFYLNKQSRAGAMCGLLEEFKDSESTKKFIREYSACPSDKIDELDIVARDKSRVSARKGLEDEVKTKLNDEQRDIYNLPANQNINVIAGAGSGKTRLLIYRALKLILDEGTNESKVLILAYNRAVRDEVEKRMAEYASSIRCPLNDMKIYTFHGYAAICIPELQENKVDFDEWERNLLQHITANPDSYRNKYRHILIDEFQDVTTTRLEIIKSLLKLNAPCNAFVVGDMFQSIYGYEKKDDNNHRSQNALSIINSIEPIEYYKTISFEDYYLKCNYRSYQTIINTAESWFDNLIDWSDKENYKQQYIDSKLIPTLQSMILDDDFSPSSDNLDTITRDGEEIKIIKPYKIIKRDSEYDWKNDFESIWNEFLSNRLTWGANPQNNPSENHFCSIGILFRGNADVQDAYKWLKERDYLMGTDIYIQGSDVFYYSTREFYFFKKKLEEKGDCIASEGIIRSLYQTMEDSKEYDKVILEVARELALYIIKKGNLSFLELSSKFDEIAKREQEKLREFLDRRQKDSRISICVSTIHKIKGLEFDCVIIPASTCPIGFNNENMSEGEKNMEERRLMYVAFSRAKYMLYYYEGDRERSIKENTAYAGINGQCYANDGQSKVDIGLLVQNWLRDNNDYVRQSVKINDAITLKQHNNYCYKNDKPKWFIYHGQENKIIGCLAQNNELLEKLYNSNKTVVEGLYVKSVNIITKEESEKQSLENEGHDWNGISEGGYVYYIDYYGCINLKDGNEEHD